MAGAGAGCAGLAGAAPVVTPGCVLLFGVTSRTPGATGGFDALFCAVLWVAGGDGLLSAVLVDELFKP